MRTPVGKRIKTAIIPTSTITLTATLEWHDALNSVVFQEDITIIGAELQVECMVVDAALNADGLYNVIGELSRIAKNRADGRFLTEQLMHGWTAAINVGGEARKCARVMFPPGYGIDVDDGEAVYMNCMFQSVGAVELSAYFDATIYYVER